MSGCNRELTAHFHSAASLKYHVPDTWHDTTPSHIILTLGWPVLALPGKSECQARSSYRNDPKFSDRYAWANNVDPDQTAPRSSLIRVYTVCHSVCIVWTHYSMVEPHSSNFRVITTNDLGVRIFRKFTVVPFLTTLVCCGPGSRSLERTLYLLSYQGRYK